MVPKHFALHGLLFTLLLSGATALPWAAVLAQIPQVASGDGSSGDIRGVVADTATGERLPGVNVSVQGTRRGATTNVQGFYLLAGLPAGSVELTFSAVGYTGRTVKVDLKPGMICTLDLKLASRVLEGKEIIVRGNRLTAATEQSASLHVMTPQEVQHLPAAAGQPDLLRSLQLLPGISSTSDVSAKFYVRGGAGDQNLILLDGMKIYNPFHAFGLFSVLDPAIIKTAEVYTGAFPAGFGGRLSSVVNVTSRDGNQGHIAGMASMNFLAGKLQLEGPFTEDNSWLVSGRSSTFSRTIDRMIPNPAPTRFYDLFFKGTSGTATSRFGVRGYVSGDDITPADLTQPDHRWRSSAASVSLSSLVSDRMYANASLSYSQSSIERLAKAGSPVAPASSRLQEFSLRAEGTSYTEGETTFLEGFAFEFPEIEDRLFSPTMIQQHMIDSELDWSFWFRAQGTTAEGLLGYDMGFHGDGILLLAGKPLFYCLQPRLALSYHLSSIWTVRAAFGIYTQNLIAVSNEDDLISLFDAWLYLPAELRPEVARHYVLGLEGMPAAGLAASIQVYRKEYPALTVYNPAKVFPTDPDYLNATGLASGAELLLRYGSDLFDLYASYGLASVTLTEGTLTYSPRYDRRHTVKAAGTVHLTEGLDFTLKWEYGSGYPFTQGAGYYDRLTLPDLDRDPFPGGPRTAIQALGEKNASRLPPYHRLDAGVEYRLALSERVRLAFGASVINLYDQKNILYYDRQTGKTDYMLPFFPTASAAVEF